MQNKQRPVHPPNMLGTILCIYVRVVCHFFCEICSTGLFFKTCTRVFQVRICILKHEQLQTFQIMSHKFTDLAQENVDPDLVQEIHDLALGSVWEKIMDYKNVAELRDAMNLMRKRLEEASQKGIDVFYDAVYAELQNYAREHAFVKPAPSEPYYLTWHEVGHPSSFLLGPRYAEKNGLSHVRCTVCCSTKQLNINTTIDLGCQKYVLILPSDEAEFSDLNEYDESLPEEPSIKNKTFYELLQLMQTKRLRFEPLLEDEIPGDDPNSEATQTLIDLMCRNLN